MENEEQIARHPFHASYLTPQLLELVEEHERGSKSIEVEIVNPRIKNFYTIGMASYKDGYNSLYKDRIQRSNDLLYCLFKRFYDFQLQFFEHIFKRRVTYMEGMPLPGFHVFKYCPEFTQPLARPHVDVPFNKYDWGSMIGENNIFTHVIPICIPTGAGMYMWDNLTALDMAKRSPESVVLEARNTNPTRFVNYREDELVIHSGKTVHMIKPYEEGGDKPPRITLQSHAVYRDKAWELYW